MSIDETPMEIDEDNKNAIRRACAKLSKLDQYILNASGDDIKHMLEWIYNIVNAALSQNPELCHRLADKEGYRENIIRLGMDQVISLLRETAQNKTWEKLLNHEIFSIKQHKTYYEPLPLEVEASKTVTVIAWNSNFEGDAANVLLDTISDYLDPTRGAYARLTSIINSSGTGKSRMVDELSTQIITIPMCLRFSPQGFPPPDVKLRDWLTKTRNGNDIAKSLDAFVFSLLNVTRERLTAIAIDLGYRENPDDFFDPKPREDETPDLVISRQEKLASAFRDLMTKDQSFETPNQYRLEFYQEVINEAESSLECCIVEEHGVPTNPRYCFKGKSATDDVTSAGDKLCKILDQFEVLKVSAGPQRPLIVISFDESHMLKYDHGGKQTLFYELRRVLRRLNKLPIFALFLSTAGYFHQFSPEINSDPSNRISSCQYPILHPISETSFDDIAFDPTDVSLNDVTTMKWISHLGRPLFGTRYDAWQNKFSQVDEDLTSFAVEKLLNGPKMPRNEREGILACLSVRFALEFNIDMAGSEVARSQVERHMRLCISPTSGLERLITISGSEPLLAEAAAEIIRESREDPASHLATHMDLNCIDLGKRGETVAALIIMQARDKAARDHQRRWISVDEFMAALLPAGAYLGLRECFPVLCRCENENKKFKETFEDYRMWFNHVIKVEDARMISVNKLWKFITRGAMVVCARTQEGVDIILPVCHKTAKLSPRTVTAILVQVKNNVKYTDHIDPVLLNNMNPFELGDFDKTERLPLPVIRMVFSLASQASVVRFRPHPKDRHDFDTITAFDIWCAGLSKDAFQPIGDNMHCYQVLLDRSLQPFNAFDLQEMTTPGNDRTTKSRSNRRRRMAALAMDGHE